MPRAVFVLSGLTLAACATSSREARTPSPLPAPVPAVAAVPGSSDAGIRWIKDDPETAFSRARREHKLVVVDLWALWCHTCLSMQTFVLTDSKLPGAGGRFVFLSVDTELAENAEFVRQFPTSGWPTFYVLSPDGPRVRGRWLGAASPAQFARFLADSERTHQLDTTSAANAEPLALLQSADELAAQMRYADAAARYAEVLAHAPPEWPRAPDTRVARASALRRAADYSACVDQVFEPTFADLRAPVSASDESSYTLECAESLPSSDPRRRPARERIEAKLSTLCNDGHVELTPDDRGDACGNLIEVRNALGDAAGARKAAETRLAVLQAAARGVPDDVAVLYDPALTETLVLLGRGEEAVSLLIAREAALPQNYNPPYHLARVALKLKRWELGLRAIDRALELVTGPRRASSYGIKTDLLLGASRPQDAITALEAELAVLDALPDGQKRAEAERTVRDRLQSLREKGASAPASH